MIAVKLMTGRFRRGSSLGIIGSGSYDSIDERERRLILMHLQMARTEDKELNKQNNQLINLASAPRSTEMNASHGHATTIKEDEIKGTVVPKMDELKGIMVPIPEVNVVGGQYERGVKGAIVDAFIEVDDNKRIMVPISEVNIVEGNMNEALKAL